MGYLTLVHAVNIIHYFKTILFFLLSLVFNIIIVKKFAHPSLDSLCFHHLPTNLTYKLP